MKLPGKSLVSGTLGPSIGGYCGRLNSSETVTLFANEFTLIGIVIGGYVGVMAAQHMNLVWWLVRYSCRFRITPQTVDRTNTHEEDRGA